jgi:hypothetical protein
MKYNKNDIVLLHFRTIKGTETRVAIIQEKEYSGIVYGQPVYNYFVLMCGKPQPVWAREEEIIEKLYSVNNNQ